MEAGRQAAWFGLIWAEADLQEPEPTGKHEVREEVNKSESAR